MSHHVAFLQSALTHSATALDFANALAKRLYCLDDHYVQPFYSWAAPRLREMAISDLYWALITLIDVTLWLTSKTRHFWTSDAHVIATDAVAHAHEPLTDFPALAPPAAPLALSSMTPAPECSGRCGSGAGALPFSPINHPQFICPR